MRWMKRGERPTEPGWYWTELPNLHGGEVVQIVSVERKMHRGAGPTGTKIGDLFFRLRKHGLAARLDIGSRFAGPIPLPEGDDDER